MNKLYLAVSVLFLLSGCSSWQQSLVKNKNWYKIGYSEGYNGYTPKWRSNYHMVNGGSPQTFDEEAYLAGFVDGQTEKCKQVRCPDSTLAER